jgi:release factor glutamine methyltransferase
VTLVERLRAAGCVYAEDEAALLTEATGDPDELERLVARRVAGEPLEAILGWAEFRGLRIAVEPGVFVPRARTGVLVEQALPHVRNGTVVVEMCAGAAAVAAAVAAEVPGAEAHAAELDPVAVRAARRNLDPARVYEGDLFDALPARLRGRIDVLVANAPYVPSGEIALMPSEARDHEPRLALDGGADGLDVQRRIAALAPEWLAPGGVLIIETSERQASGTVALLAAAGFEAHAVHDDELDGTAAVGVLQEGGEQRDEPPRSAHR